MKKSEITFLTPESVSVLYEGLSTKTNVYVFHHEHHTDDQYGSKRKTKVTRNIDKLKKQGHIGFIDSKRHMLSRSIKSADLIHPNHDVLLCEVKEVVKKLLELP